MTSKKWENGVPPGKAFRHMYLIFEDEVEPWSDKDIEDLAEGLEGFLQDEGWSRYIQCIVVGDSFQDIYKAVELGEEDA